MAPQERAMLLWFTQSIIYLTRVIVEEKSNQTARKTKLLEGFGVFN